mgnify:CR=1 FL=1
MKRMRKALVIPGLIVALTLVALSTANTYGVPTVEIQFVDVMPAEVAAVEFVVEGLKCRGTSMGFARLISGLPGVVSLTTYTRARKAVVEYDPAEITPDEIRASYEAPIVRDGREYRVFTTISQSP